MQVLFWSGRQLKRIGITLGLLALLAVVIGMAAAQWVMANAERDPQGAKQWLSLQARAPIDFDGLQSRWTRRGPVMDVKNLRLGQGKTVLRLGDAQLMLSLYDGWMPNRSFSQLRLTGLRLDLFRHEDGRWELLGLPKSQGPQADPLDALSRLGELQVVNGSLRVRAPASGIDTLFPKANLRMRADAGRFRGGVQAWSQLSTAAIQAAVNFDRKTRSGTLWVSSLKTQLADWSSVLKFGDLQIERGAGDLSAWLEIREQRVTAITGSLKLNDVAVRNTGTYAGERTFDQLDALGKWTHGADWWSVAIPRLHVTRAGERSDMSRTLLSGGRAQVFNAAQLNGGVLADLAVIVPWLPEQIRSYLLQSQVRGNLRDVRFVRRNGAIETLAGEIRDVRVLPSNGYPGVQGLTAKISGGKGDWNVDLTPSGNTLLSIPQQLLQPLNLRLDGRIRVQQLPDRLAFSTRDFRVLIEGYPFVLNGGVIKLVSQRFPTFNLNASAARFPVDKAKLFWVRGKMPPSAIAWLDPAFVAGEVHDLQASVVGNPADWPFVPGRGLLATGRLVNGEIHFAQGWPNAKQVNGRLHFANDGFDVKATGMLDKIPVDDIVVGIDHYRNGTLRIRAGAVTDAGNAISMLAKSPIAENDPETFASLKARGPVRSGFALDLPLHPAGTLAINGLVDFKGVTVSDPRYKITMTHLTGRGTYNRNGFLAENLTGLRDGTSGNLSVRVGPGQVRDNGNIVEVALNSALSPRVIDNYTSSLAWLKPYLSGTARWNVQVNVPSQRQGKRPAVLLLKSDLLGMEMSLPEPLYKPASQSLATQLEIPLPLENNEMTLSFGRKAGMKIISRGNTPWVRVMLGGAAVPSPTQAGLTVEGTAERISALDWIAVAKSDTPSAATVGSPDVKLDLNRIDVLGRNVYLLGGNFRNTRVILTGQRNGAIAITADGPQLRGSVAVPASNLQAIRGTFDFVQFSTDGLPEQTVNRSLQATGTGTAASRAVHSAALAISNPANLPPLQFSANRLQIGGVSLGAASFESIPVAGGLKVTRMQTRHPTFIAEGSGSWMQQGASQTTSIVATVKTPDAGRAVASFGAPDQLKGGKGEFSLNASWPGGPQELAIDRLQGGMAIDVHDGIIPEVEPGVGRVLGLLSIAELPRRMTLDFRDFFDKGLRFNRIWGNVELGNGLATARELRIDASAAAIRIEGSSDLKAERFNQVVTVEPRAGGLLTAIGAVTAGPVGAAVGALANAVLQKPIGEMTTKRYRVTGPWTAPQTEVIPAGKP